MKWFIAVVALLCISRTAKKEKYDTDESYKEDTRFCTLSNLIGFLLLLAVVML